MTRIIAGSAKGRRLLTPKGQLTRPTTEKTREAFFSTIASWAGTISDPVDVHFNGLAFLDLYSGSGAIGLEAASRGASRVVLVENDPKAIAVIKNNIKSTRLKANLQAKTVQKVLSDRAPKAFDVIWMDPPYLAENEEIEELIATLWRNDWLVHDGLIAVERPYQSAPLQVADATEHWSKRYGDTCIYYFRFDDLSEVEETSEK